MPYVTPRTWVAGDVLTAAQLNQDIRDNLLAAFPLGVAGWTSYTPTLTQTSTVTKTVTYAKYQRVGRLIFGSVRLDVTGTGTAAAAVVVGFPVAAAVSTNLTVGSGHILDASAGFFYGGIARLRSATEIDMIPTSSDTPNVLGVQAFTAALAAGDVVSVSFMYEAAT